MQDKYDQNNVPYGGNIDEAMKAQDREAIRFLLSQRSNKDDEDKKADDSEEEEQCMICFDEFNKGRRRRIICPGECGEGCCEECFRRHLLESSSSTPFCPKCNHKLSLEFVADVTPKSFHNGTYRRKRSLDLLSKERSLLPATQHLIVDIEERKRREEIIYELMDESRYLRFRLGEIEDEIGQLRRRVYHKLSEKKERKKFIMGCPVPECRGFLSQAWKCGTCGRFTCSKCRIVKEGKNDDHVCSDDDIATAKLLAKETKPCPKCAVPIFKISGCFAKDTPILMWDGTIKVSQNIVVGDELIGDDGTKRTVTDLTSGTDTMYTVTQKRAEPYTVNSKHTLALKFCGNKTIKWSESMNAWILKWFDQKARTKTLKTSSKLSKSKAYSLLEQFRDNLDTPDTIEILVEDYLKLPISTRKRLKGFRASEVKWDHKPVLLDPYILGMWLGDGYSNGKEFASNDPELVERWKMWGEQNDAEVVKTTNKFRYYVRRASDSTVRSNPLKDCLSQYNLVNNKHIPSEYLTNSREIRLALLAGLIDTDGCVQHEGRRIVIIQANPVLSEQIVYLARSLGFSCSLTIRSRQTLSIFGQKSKDYKDQQHINISGSFIDEIPTLLTRKRCVRQEGGVDLLRTGIDIKQTNKGKYFGWRVDGNKRFLLSDFTVARNCDQMWCTECQTPFSWKTGQVVSGVIHNPHFYQWQRQQNNGNAPRRPGTRYDCGGMPWLRTIRHIIKTRKIVFKNWEECHRSVHHFRVVVMPSYPLQVGVEDHTDLRLKFLLKDINEEQWLSKLRRRQKKIEKNQEIHNILDMFVVTLTDLFQRFTTQYVDLPTEAYAIRDYVNEELRKVSIRYNNVVPQITKEWGCKSWK